jgi:hypothetical protein
VNVSRLLARVTARAATSLGRDNCANALVLDASAGHPAALDTFQRAIEALSMLQERSAVHVRWLQRCVNQIVLVPAMHSMAAYERNTRSVYLNVELGRQYDAIAVAAAIVHEVTHARVSAFGLRPSGASVAWKGRLEHRCVREQLEALLRMNPDHQFVAWSRELLRSRAEEDLLPSAEDRRVIGQRSYRRGAGSRPSELDREIGRPPRKLACRQVR